MSEAGRVSMNSSRDERSHGKPKRKRDRISFRARVLPWSASSDDDARFRRIAERVLITCAIFFILLPWLPVRKPDPTVAPVISAPMAKLLIDQNKPEPPKATPPKAKAELDIEASREVILKENESDSKRVTIMGDKDIPYRLLRKIMYTSARANFSDVSFAVRQRFES